MLDNFAKERVPYEIGGLKDNMIPGAYVRFKASGEEGVIKKVFGFRIMVLTDSGKSIQTEIPYVELVKPYESTVDHTANDVNSKINHIASPIPVEVKSLTPQATVQFSKQGQTISEANADPISENQQERVKSGLENGYHLINFSHPDRVN